MWMFITLRHVVLFMLFSFILGGSCYTLAETHVKGGSFIDWLDGFFE